MTEFFTFQFLLGVQPVFERNGEYFTTRDIGPDQLAYGLFSNETEGFEPVGDVRQYERIDEIKTVNDSLKLLSIVGVDQDQITIAIEYSGEYEYFRLTGIRAQELSDPLALQLAGRVRQKKRSAILHPYIVQIKENKIQSVK